MSQSHLVHHEVPTMSFFDSLGFVQGDPFEFMRKGRLLGDHWAFWVLQPELPPWVKVYVFSNETPFGNVKLSHPPFRFGPLRGFLGQHSVLLNEADLHKQMLEVTSHLYRRLLSNKEDLMNRLRHSVPEAVEVGLDLAEVLRRELVGWVVHTLIQSDTPTQEKQATQLALRWLQKADGPALFLTPLRWLPPWWGMDRLIQKLIRVMGYEHDLVQAHAVLTLIDGVVDNTTATVLDVLCLIEEAGLWADFKHQWKAIMATSLEFHPPIPLILREAEEDQTVEGVFTPKGSGLAFDAARRNLQFGEGAAHQCIGAALAEQIIQVTGESFPYSYFRPVRGPMRRIRLTCGMASLFCKAR